MRPVHAATEPHLIQAKFARDTDPATYRHGTVISVQHDGWITVDVDGNAVRFWNHDPARVRGCFQKSGGTMSCRAMACSMLGTRTVARFCLP